MNKSESGWEGDAQVYGVTVLHPPFAKIFSNIIISMIRNRAKSIRRMSFEAMSVPVCILILQS